MKNLSGVRSVLLVGAALLGAMGCTRRGGTATDTDELSFGQFRDKNLVMISLGNIGASHMSLYGYQRATTPQLDRWAEQAIVFETTYTPASWTLPAAVSLFTALYPYSHRVYGRRLSNSLSKRVKTLAQTLATAGYVSAAFTGGLDYYQAFPQLRGFDVVADNPNFTGYEVTLAQARDWLAKNGHTRFFLFIHGYDAHCPYTPTAFGGAFSSTAGKKIQVDRAQCYRDFNGSEADGGSTKYEVVGSGGCPNFNVGEPLGTMGACQAMSNPLLMTQDDIDYLEASYDEEVLAVDAQVGRFLADLEVQFGDNTLFIVLSEHGEMFAKHGRFGRAGIHRGTPYDDVMRVPFVIRTPDHRGARVRGLTQLIDVMPTVLDLLGLSGGDAAQGRSLLPLVNTGSAVNEYAFAGLRFNVRLSAEIASSPFPHRSASEWVRTAQWKLIREVLDEQMTSGKAAPAGSETWELYDINADAQESNNLWQVRQDVALELKLKLERWARWSKARAAGLAPAVEIPEELIEDAERFGYP